MASGTIVDRRYNLLPECCEYTVKSPPASAASGGPQGRSCTPCRAVRCEVIEQAGNELSTMACLVTERAFEHMRELDGNMRGATRRSGSLTQRKFRRCRQAHGAILVGIIDRSRTG
jgi:hypothetical protein